MKINIINETATLKAVILGTAESNGDTPTVEQAYDPKSIEHIKAGTYPLEKHMTVEMSAFKAVLEKYDVEVFRPEIIENYNQIFSRDIGFVIDDVFIKSKVIADRSAELDAVQYIIDTIATDKVITPPDEVRMEGGDVMPWNDHIFIGTCNDEDFDTYMCARTNTAGVDFIKQQFPQKTVKAFNLRKSDTQAKDNALHLDCCFQPVGADKAIIYKGGFVDEADYDYLVNFFGADNIFAIERDEMYQMNSNIFSISETVVVSERNFTRLNTWLREHGFTVEEIAYAEIGKQEGLLRCSTLPLIRESSSLCQTQ